MSTPMSHTPLAPLGSRRLTWFLVAGLAIAGLTVALVLMLSGSNSPSPVRAVPAPAAVAPASGAAVQAPDRDPFQHGFPSLNPQVGDPQVGVVTPDAASGTQGDVPPYSAPATQGDIPPYVAPSEHGHNHPGGR